MSFNSFRNKVTHKAIGNKIIYEEMEDFDKSDKMIKISG